MGSKERGGQERGEKGEGGVERRVIGRRRRSYEGDRAA